MSEKVNEVKPTSAVSLTPLARVVRTVLQTVIAFGGALPTILAVTNLSAAQSAEVSGIVGGLVFVASAVQNILEHFGVIPVAGGSAVEVAK